jgi:response regulator RpfG family c-di-GMP phosphodiesterase
MPASKRVLIIDDDTNLLAGLRRLLGPRFDLVTASGGAEALERLAADGPFAVAVCDMRMPGMDGLEVLTRLQAASPDTVRMMLTGNADQKTAVDAINGGAIFRFFNKPCSVQALSAGIEAAIRQYQLVTAERALLEGTLAGAIALLTDVLSLVAPDSFERSLRLRHWALRIMAEMRIDNGWEIELAASLAHIGSITVPPEVMARRGSGQRLSAAEEDMIERIPLIGAQMIAKIPRLQGVADAVRLQAIWFNGQGSPAGRDLPLAARILHLLLAIDEAGQGVLTSEAMAVIETHPGRFDPAVVAAARSCLTVDHLAEGASQTRISVPARGLLPGDLLESDLALESGKLILAAGQTITDALYLRLGNLKAIYRFQEPIRIRRVSSNRVNTP